MDDILVRIKRAVLSGRYGFSQKARTEMVVDGISELDVVEAILIHLHPGKRNTFIQRKSLFTRTERKCFTF